MINLHETQITKDPSEPKLIVVREFSAPVAKVWRAWTEAELLNQWWAPRPWRTETKSLNFVSGGLWLYSMVSPEGEKHWSRVDILEVDPGKSFRSVAVFCDEEGKPNTIAPEMKWFVNFEESETGTKVIAEIGFNTEAEMNTLVEMGFKGGFTMALGNLDELLNN